MRRILLTASLAVFAVTACDSARKPTSANFAAAIDRYLVVHGQLCVPIGSQFPIDVPISQQTSPNGLSTKLQALQRAGLLNETYTTAVVQSLANSLSLTPHKAELVRRYTVSTEGQKYLNSVMTDFGPTPGFCYGLKQVDSIIKWTEPVTSGSFIESEITYRYRVVNLSSWASRSDVQREFPAMMDALRAVSKENQLVGVQLASNGWVVVP